MPRLGVRVLSGRVPFRHTACRKASLGGRHTCSSTALMRVPHLSLRFRIRSHATHSRHQHGLGISFQREYFLCAVLRFVSSQQLGFCSSTALLAMVLAYQRLVSLQIRIPLFLSSLLRWLTSHVLILLLQYCISSGGSLRVTYYVGLRHQHSFRPVSAFCSLVSLPNSVFGAASLLSRWMDHFWFILI